MANHIKLFDISKNLLDLALEYFINADTKYIQSALLEKSPHSIKLDAYLSVPQTCFLNPPSDHLNSVDMMICLNQICLVYLFGAISSGLLPCYSGISIDYFNIFKRNISIVEYQNVRFKRPICNQSFFGTVELTQLRSANNKILFQGDFIFGNVLSCPDCIGKIKFFTPKLR